LLLVATENNHSEFSFKETAQRPSKFYRLRREVGSSAEKSYGLKQAVVDNATISQLCQMLKTSPFPRFERRGLLELSEDERSFVLNPALLEALAPVVRDSLRRKAIARLMEHFGEGEKVVEEMLERSIE
jgi:hypothetical protein